MTRKFLALFLLAPLTAFGQGKNISQVCADQVSYYSNIYRYSLNQSPDVARKLVATMEKLSIGSDTADHDVFLAMTDDSRKVMWQSMTERGMYFKQFMSACIESPRVYIPTWTLIVESGYVDQAAAANVPNPYEGAMDAFSQRLKDEKEAAKNIRSGRN